MSELIKKLIKEHWTEIGTEEEKQLINSLSAEVAKQYIEAIRRLETDFGFQAELGIGN